MYLSFTQKLGFIHIPKCAGTTLTKFFYDNLKLGDYLIGGYESESNLKFYEQKFKISKHTSLNQLYASGYLDSSLRDFNWFTIIREPIDRIKSVFKYCKQYSNVYKNFNNFKTINDFISSPFFLESNGFGNIFAPQFQFINCKKPNLKIKIFKMSEMDQIQDFLSQYNIPFDKNIVINKSSFIQNNEISNDNILRVKQKYVKDFEFFNN